MAEIIRNKIRSVYGELLGYYEGLIQANRDNNYTAANIQTVDSINECIGRLCEVSSTDYSRNKIVLGHSSSYKIMGEVLVKLKPLLSRLEIEHNFKDNGAMAAPQIVILNKNNNEITVNIDYTLDQLINEQNDDGKAKLLELKEELNKSEKNWGVIKGILIWAINFSKDLFIKILPIILEKKI
jgi:hypothetical protein